MAREVQLQETHMLEQTLQIPTDQQSPQIPEADELTTYSFNELLDLNYRLQAELQHRQAAELEAHKEKTRQLARALGITVEQMFAFNTTPTSPRAPRGTRPPKQPIKVAFRDPLNADNVASAKGPKPDWLKTYLEQGRDIEEFRVQE
jgi:DNA-binding protein H-NS